MNSTCQGNVLESRFHHLPLWKALLLKKNYHLHIFVFLYFGVWKHTLWFFFHLISGWHFDFWFLDGLKWSLEIVFIMQISESTVMLLGNIIGTLFCFCNIWHMVGGKLGNVDRKCLFVFIGFYHLHVVLHSEMKLIRLE